MRLANSQWVARRGHMHRLLKPEARLLLQHRRDHPGRVEGFRAAVRLPGDVEMQGGQGQRQDFSRVRGPHLSQHGDVHHPLVHVRGRHPDLPVYRCGRVPPDPLLVLRRPRHVREVLSCARKEREIRARSEESVNYSRTRVVKEDGAGAWRRALLHANDFSVRPFDRGA